MPAPDRIPGTRICLTVTPEGVKLYGNREAFQSLAQFMSWIADSNPTEHFECHVRWHMTSEGALLRNETPNVATLFAPALVGQFERASESNPGFELTFMAVEEADLDEMFRHAVSGVLPDSLANGGE